jgi:Flp pilus assembly protein TadB
VVRIRGRVERLGRTMEEARLRQWRREEGPGPVLRWSLHHPWLVTGALAAVLTVVLGATFGIPPLSPLLLVALFVAPVPWWLRRERRVYERWRSER